MKRFFSPIIITGCLFLMSCDRLPSVLDYNKSENLLNGVTAITDKNLYFLDSAYVGVDIQIINNSADTIFSFEAGDMIAYAVYGKTGNDWTEKWSWPPPGSGIPFRELKIAPDSAYSGSIWFSEIGLYKALFLYSLKSDLSRTDSLFTNEFSVVKSWPNCTRGDTIYFNSFESDTDTCGWEGNGEYTFRDEAAPNGGVRSLFVSGGCIAPHALYKLPPQSASGYYILQGWGRDLEMGGHVQLEVEGEYPGIYFSVNDSLWTEYQSADTLFCAADKQMVLSFMSGGIAPSAMLVDRLAVVKLKLPATSLK